MTLQDIVFKNLLRRKSKAAFVLLGLLIGVASVVSFLSLINALTHDINSKLEQYGANILILPQTENLSLSYGGLSLGGVFYEMQEIHQGDLRKIHSIKNAQNVAAVGPVVLGPVEVNNRKVLLAGIDFEVSYILRPWWIVKGAIPGKDGFLAGAEAARILGLKVGDSLALNGRVLVTAGILEATGSQDDQILFTPLETGQGVLGKKGRISMAEVAALCSGCPVEEMVVQIGQALPGAKIMAIKQVVQGRMETLEHFRRVAYGLSAVVALVGGLVVFVTMMASVRERTSEIGIFRAIGFRSSQIMRIILLEAGIVSAAAGGLGYWIGIGATKLALPLFSQGHGVEVPIDPVLAGSAFFLALFLGLVASLYPAIFATRLDPNEALRAL